MEKKETKTVKKTEPAQAKLTKAEERAIVKGAYQALLPAFFIGLGVFCLAFLVLMLWFWIKIKFG